MLVPALSLLAGRNSRVRRVHNRRTDRRQLRVVRNRFSLRYQALPVSFHQFVLQSCISARGGWLVLKRSFAFSSSGIGSLSSDAAMGIASVLSGRSSVVCPRRGATSAKSRSTCADCDNCPVVADVRAAWSNARALSRLGGGGQRSRAGR